MMAENNTPEQETAKTNLAERLKSAGKAAPVVETAASRIRKASAIGAQAAKAKKDSRARQKQEQSTYNAMKPPRGKFVRVHPSPDYRILDVPVLLDQDTGKVYFVESEAIELLPQIAVSEIRYANFYFAQAHDGTYFLWPIYRSDTPWFEAARKAAAKCSRGWYAVRAAKTGSTYNLMAPEGVIPEPDWGGIPSFDEILNEAFDETIITSADHPFVQRLTGLASDEDSCDAGF